MVLSIVTGLLFGVVPAWQASRPELQNTLKDATRGTTGDGHRHLARMGLVLAEVSLSLMLLVGAGLLFRSLMNLLDVPLGFSSARITTTQVAPTGEGYRAPGQSIAYWNQVLDRLQAVPGVEQVALTNAVPMGGSISILSYNVAGKPELPPNQSPLSHFASVSPGFFATLGIPVVRGREFERGDAVENPRVVVINEAMARREFEGQDAIGQRISFGPGPDDQPEWLEIVGVVGNIRQYGVEQEPVPTTYVVHTSSPAQPLTILVRSAGEPAAVAGAIRAGLQSVDAALPITRHAPAGRSDRRVAHAAALQRHAAGGVRGHRAGPRHRRHLRHGVVRRRAAHAGTGHSRRARRHPRRRAAPGAVGRRSSRSRSACSVGIVGSFLLRSSLDRLVYGVSTSDPATFLALPVLLAAVAVVASLIPALRAARVDPMTALRVD